MTTHTMGRTAYYSVRQVADLLGLTTRTVYRMCHAGHLAYILTGSTGTTYRIPGAALADHLAPATPPATASHCDGQIELAG